MIEIRTVRTRLEKQLFLTFPWQMYKSDPLWVAPILSERQKAADPATGMFFKNGYAEFFLAYREGVLAGTLCCSHENTGDPAECSLGFFECVDDYAVAAALFDQAESWARQHNLVMLCGTYNLDREDGRGILVEGLERPPVLLCGHNPPYYVDFFERYGFTRRHDDGLAYAFDLDPHDPKIKRIYNLAARVEKRKSYTIRAVNMKDLDAEIDRVLILQNRALEHLPGFVAYSRESIEAMLLPLKDLADPDLVLFAEADGNTVGWFPAIPNYNEILIHLNGLRYPWDYLRALRYKNLKPKCLSVKSVAVLPEYWDTGVAVLLFTEMIRRAIAKGYQWADLSLTGEENPDTFDLAHHMGARIYKRYRFFRKDLA
jgi:GNAT superfamily N-acetyltransferase